MEENNKKAADNGRAKVCLCFSVALVAGGFVLLVAAIHYVVRYQVSTVLPALFATGSLVHFLE